MPLAARLRPRSLEEYVGQEHLLGTGKLLRRAIDSDRFSSIILSGPPGTGKTSLAEVVARRTHSAFVRLSGVTSSVADIRREIVRAVERRRADGIRTILSSMRSIGSAAPSRTPCFRMSKTETSV